MAKRAYVVEIVYIITFLLVFFFIRVWVAFIFYFSLSVRLLCQLEQLFKQLQIEEILLRTRNWNDADFTIDRL